MKKHITLFLFFTLLVNLGFSQITPTLITSVTVVNNASNCTICDGKATMNVTGGVAPYHYSWASGETTQTATALCSGTFTVGAYDSGTPFPGFGVGSVTITCPTGVNAYVNADDIRLFPNPARNEFYLEVNAGMQGKIDFSIHNVLGEKVYAETLESSGSLYKWIDISLLPIGYYEVEIMNGSQVIRKKLIKQ